MPPRAREVKRAIAACVAGVIAPTLVITS